MKILESASKIVFIMIALATVIAMFMNIITGEQFMVLGSMVFAFYFTKSVPNTVE